MKSLKVVITASMCESIKRTLGDKEKRIEIVKRVNEYLWKHESSTDPQVYQWEVDCVQVALTSQTNEVRCIPFEEDYEPTDEEMERDKEIRNNFRDAGFTVLHDDSTGGFTILF